MGSRMGVGGADEGKAEDGGAESQTLMDTELSCDVFFSIFLFFLH